ncbi:VOC family protein [Kribbella sp. CWNU-51]
MAINAVPAVIPVAGFDEACDWYAAFFGRPADQRPMDSLAERHLIDGGVIQIFNDAEKAGRTAVNFFVDDLDERVAQLTKADISATDPTVHRRARRLDPRQRRVAGPRPRQGARR